MIVLSHLGYPVDGLAFAPVGPLLVAGHGHRWLGVWDSATRRFLGEYRRNHVYTRPTFRFHPTLPQVYHLGKFDQVHRFDPVTRESGVLCERVGWAENMVLTRDAGRLLVYSRGHCEFRLFDLSRGSDAEPVWAVPVYSRVVHGIRLCVEFLPGEDRFIVAESHGNTRTRVSIRSTATGELLAAGRVPFREVFALALAPDGGCAVVQAETSLLVYAPENLKAAPRKIANDSKKHFTGIAFHPSGRYLAATSNDATVKLYDTATWEVARTFTWDIGKMRSVAFSPDGSLAAAGSDTGKVVVWDVDL